MKGHQHTENSGIFQQMFEAHRKKKLAWIIGNEDEHNNKAP